MSVGLSSGEGRAPGTVPPALLWAPSPQSRAGGRLDPRVAGCLRGVCVTGARVLCGSGPGALAERRSLCRHSATVAQLQEKLAGAQRQLGQLRAQEAGLQREQRKADTHKKMTEF